MQRERGCREREKVKREREKKKRERKKEMREREREWLCVILADKHSTQREISLGYGYEERERKIAKRERQGEKCLSWDDGCCCRCCWW
jgi:hypothetical protein